MVVLVIGKNGQLAQCLNAVSADYPSLTLFFKSSSEADILDESKLRKVFSELNPHYCINTAAYTAVDKAESEPELAHAINSSGVANLAEVCKSAGTTLIHISTDFVFDGRADKPYHEDDITNPLSVYGGSKLSGEINIREILQQHLIIRTSWLYSEFGNNFKKTMLRLAAERDVVKVVNDQTGTPTNCLDLAQAILSIIASGIHRFGTFNFSNEGSTTWFGFAQEIFRKHNVTTSLLPISTSDFPTPAVRPKYSVLDKSKIKEIFGLKIRNWQDAV